MIRIGVLNGSNNNQDSMFQAGVSHLLTQGVFNGFSGQMQVTNNNVAPGMAYVKVTRTSTVPNEEFLVLVENTSNFTVDTSGNGVICILIDADKINDPSLVIDEDGSGVAEIVKLPSLPGSNALLLAELTSSVITDARSYARVRTESQGNTWHKGTAGGTANDLTLTIPSGPVLSDGLSLLVTVTENNTGAATLNYNGTGAFPIRKLFSTELGPNDLRTGQKLWVTYDSTNTRWQVSSGVATSDIGTVDLVKVSASDTTAGYLTQKFQFNNLNFTVLNPGANEQISLTNDVMKIDKYTDIGTHTWVKPANAKRVVVYMWGGGGGGGGAPVSHQPSSVGPDGMGSTSNSLGGGGGGLVIREFFAESLSSSEPVLVGAGGLGGDPGPYTAGSSASIGGDGLDGGTSYFGGSTYRVHAMGGIGGGGGWARDPNQHPIPPAQKIGHGGGAFGYGLPSDYVNQYGEAGQDGPGSTSLSLHVLALSFSMYGGGAGSALTGVVAGISMYGGGGGGAGYCGPYTTAPGDQNRGGSPGGFTYITTNISGGMILPLGYNNAGFGSTPPSPGLQTQWGGGGGGGGGGHITGSVPADGGHGAVRGGGGGGGSISRNMAHVAGRGGDGGRGEVWVITYF